MSQPAATMPRTSLVERVTNAVGSDAAALWWGLADKTHGVAFGRDPGPVLRALDEAAAADPASPLAPAFHLWAADALSRVSRDNEAIVAYDRVIAAAQDAPPFERIEFVHEALRHRAASHLKIGDFDAAIDTSRDLAKRGDDAALVEVGATLERAGRRGDAAALYREVAGAPGRTDRGDGADWAARAADRLETDEGVFTPSALGIAKSVQDALASGDLDELRRLKSRTHFRVGPGAGHFQFEGDEVFDWLCEDLKASRPQPVHRGLLGSGDKRYLLTRGWAGKRFRYVVGFYFERSGRGWAWEGVIVNAPADPWIDRWEPEEKQSNQALTLRLLAPWPEGRYFTAGGLSLFMAQSATIAALAAIPFFGAAAAAAQAFIYSLSNCGFGLRGFYYNAGPTHTGTEAFAIDFSAYRKGIPFWNVSGGTPVLSPADGIVRCSRGDVPSGASWAANEVRIDHDDPATGTPRYVTRYLHFAGPGLVLVSAAMPAPTGRRLGLMNDTGNSVIDHLHFSIHDSWAGPDIGPSVRPTPMDGYLLGDDNSGRCVRSSNREIVVLPPGCGAVVVELLQRLLGRR